MLKETFKIFLQHAKIERGLSNRTIQTYEGTIKLLLMFLNLPDLKVSTITTEMFRNFLYHGSEERGWGNKTYHIHYDNLNVFCRWLERNDYIRTNPVEKLDKPKLEKKIIQPLPKEQVYKILYVSFTKSAKDPFLRSRNHTMIMLGFHSGLRMSEILSLKLTDINLKEKLIHVRLGKGAKDRIVVMTDELQSHLESYVKEHEKFFQSITIILFPSKSGKAFNKREFMRLIERLKKLSGVKFASHDFRRTYATNLSRKNVSPFVIQQQLGHSDISTTMRYVTHSEDERKEIIGGVSLY